MTLYLVGGGEERYVVEKRGMTGFIKAIFARFNEPRSFPDDPKETAKLGAITVRSFREKAHLWWTIPVIFENGDRRGAKLWDWSPWESVLWFLDGFDLTAAKAECD